MRITVAICTWNRAQQLDKTLTELSRLTIPDGIQWELLVVNNACADDTDDVIARHARQLPLRRVYEANPGLSHARNAAVRASDGDLILWTDDDVLVDPHWLAEYAAAAQAHPEVSFFGGTIGPWFEIDPPAWVLANWSQLAGVFAARDFGDQSWPIDDQSLPFGANFAIRTPVQRAFAYNPRLGRVGSHLISGEETELLRELLAAGHRGLSLPAATVRHFIPRERLTEDYVRRFYFGIGQTHLVQSEQPTPLTSWQRLRLRTRATIDELKCRLRRHTGRSDRWVKYLIRASFTRGRLAGLPQV